MQEHILSWITFLPLIGMGLILLVPRSNVAAVKGISMVATAIPLVLATWVYFGLFERGSDALQLVELKAVEPGYPLRGQVRTALRPFDAGTPADAPPAPGEA